MKRQVSNRTVRSIANFPDRAQDIKSLFNKHLIIGETLRSGIMYISCIEPND